jgi:hypothetical protein
MHGLFQNWIKNTVEKISSFFQKIKSFVLSSIKVSKTEVSFTFPKNFFESSVGDEPITGSFSTKDLTIRQKQVAGLLFEYECYFAIIKKGFKNLTNINQSDYESKKAEVPFVYPQIVTDAESLANSMIQSARQQLGCVDSIIFQGGSYGAKGSGRQDTADIRFVCTGEGVGFSLKYKSNKPKTNDQNTNINLANLSISSLFRIFGEDESKILEKRKILNNQIKKEKQDKESKLKYTSDEEIIEGWRLMIATGNQYSYAKTALREIGKPIKEITLNDLQSLRKKTLELGKSLPVVRQKLSSLKSLLKFAQEKNYANFLGTGIFPRKEIELDPFGNLITKSTRQRDSQRKKIAPDLIDFLSSTNEENANSADVSDDNGDDDNIYFNIKNTIRSMISTKITNSQEFARFLNLMLTGGGNTSVLVGGEGEGSIQEKLKKDFNLLNNLLVAKDNSATKTGCTEGIESQSVNRWRRDALGCRSPGDFYIKYKNTYIFFKIYPKSWNAQINLKIT